MKHFSPGNRGNQDEATVGFLWWLLYIHADRTACLLLVHAPGPTGGEESCCWIRHIESFNFLSWFEKGGMKNHFLWASGCNGQSAWPLAKLINQSRDTAPTVLMRTKWRSQRKCFILVFFLIFCCYQVWLIWFFLFFLRSSIGGVAYVRDRF